MMGGSLKDLTLARAWTSDVLSQYGNPCLVLCPHAVLFSFNAWGFITSGLVKWLGAPDWHFNWDKINEMCMSGSQPKHC